MTTPLPLAAAPAAPTSPAAARGGAQTPGHVAGRSASRDAAVPGREETAGAAPDDAFAALVAAMLGVTPPPVAPGVAGQAVSADAAAGPQAQPAARTGAPAIPGVAVGGTATAGDTAVAVRTATADAAPGLLPAVAADAPAAPTAAAQPASALAQAGGVAAPGAVVPAQPAAVAAAPAPAVATAAAPAAATTAGGPRPSASDAGTSADRKDPAAAIGAVPVAAAVDAPTATVAAAPAVPVPGRQPRGHDGDPPAPSLGAVAGPAAAPVAPPLARLDTVAAPAAPAAPAPAPTPAAQLAAVIAPLSRGPDGSHRITVRLHPDDLGAVDLSVEVRGAAVTLRVHAHEAVGHAALAAALPQLRDELRRAGVGGDGLDLDLTGGQQGGRDGDPTAYGGAASDRPDGRTSGNGTEQRAHHRPHTGGDPSRTGAGSAGGPPTAGLAGLDLRL